MSAPSGQSALTGSTTTAVALPPWMLLWMVGGLAFDIPFAVRYWRQYVPDLTGGGAYSAEVVSSPSFSLLRLNAVVQLAPYLVLVVGLTAVALPQARAAVVERRLGLTGRTPPVIVDMENFLREHGADVEVRCNPVRQGRLARIYPAGWRRARLAVFGPLIALWRRDQPAAQAVLLHEVAHLRTGDHLFLGLGSPLVALVNLWVPLVTVFGLLPLLGLALVHYPTAYLLSAQLPLLLALLPQALLLPVGALWSAELSADRYVVDCGLQAGLLRALGTQGRRGGRYLHALTHLSHPPRALRLWAICGGSGRAVALLASWPLLILPLLLVTIAGAVPAWFILGDSAQQVVETALHSSGAFLAYYVRTWVPAAVLLLIWPVVAPSWTRWWAGRAVGRSSVPSHLHVTAALLVTIVQLPLFLLTR